MATPTGADAAVEATALLAVAMEAPAAAAPITQASLSCLACLMYLDGMCKQPTVLQRLYLSIALMTKIPVLIPEKHIVHQKHL